MLNCLEKNQSRDNFKTQIVSNPISIIEGGEMKYLKAKFVLKATLEDGISSCSHQEPHTFVFY